MTIPLHSFSIASRCRRLAASGALAAALAQGGFALDFSFTQSGFAEGALVTGQFSGVDTDGNGILSYNPSEGFAEVSDFSLSFSGNALISAFSLDFSHLAQLVFFLDGDGIIGNDIGPDPIANPFDVEGIYASDGVFEYISGQGQLSIDGGMIFSDAGFDETAQGGAVSGSGPVATPDAGSTLSLLALSFFGLMSVRRWRSR